MVLALSIFSVAAAAVSSNILRYSSSFSKAPPKLMPSFQRVNWLVTGKEMNISTTPITIKRYHGLATLQKPRLSMGCLVRVTR